MADWVPKGIDPALVAQVEREFAALQVKQND